MPAEQTASPSLSSGGRWRTIGIWSLVLSLLIFTLSLVSAYRELTRVNRLTSLSFGQQTFILFKTSEELEHFWDAVSLYVQPVPFRHNSRADMQLSFELLASRITSFEQGEVNRAVLEIPEVREVIEGLNAALADIEPRLTRLTPDPLDPDYNAIWNSLYPYRQALFDISKRHLLQREVRGDRLLREFNATSSNWYLAAPAISGLVLLLLYFFQFRQTLRLAAFLRLESRQLRDSNRQLRKASDTLSFQATHDALTGLSNRLLLQDRLAHAISVAQRKDSQVAVMFLDLDRFKDINDSLGHSAGDALLQVIAARLTASVREVDTVARISGDEFALILEDTVVQDEPVLAVAQRIAMALRAPCLLDGQELSITGSIGISLYPRDGGSVEQLLSNADMAMYAAKEKGRNTVQLYHPSMNTDNNRRLKLGQELRHALHQDELELLFQPQLDLEQEHIIGVEALLRWRHPQRGLIGPADFIPQAEENGLIVPIGEWVLATACRQAVAWQALGLPPMIMAVNLSARQFQHPSLVAQVADTLQQTGLAAECLELELTESLLIRDVESAIAAMNTLRSLGVSLSIDDFGTGYSSLSYLQQFPVSQLKIDGSFVGNLPAQPGAIAIVRAIIAMSKSLQLRVLAEGIETREQLNFLRSLQCDRGQGYYFSRPLPAAEITKLLQQQVRKSGDETTPQMENSKGHWNNSCEKNWSG
ncbi:putative bifunctional diguanylate cyclase/phosphodiesterase [Zobellella maritima]|uniref:putative bifunctional diguanylate cyclase/phosphodiesterase n=1 Tax=Zobellella maritima TaxID=2059725 RepID=UPI000E30637A|nr:EAL domain-containing protein [Zobellella maritima]